MIFPWKSCSPTTFGHHSSLPDLYASRKTAVLAQLLMERTLHVCQLCVQSSVYEIEVVGGKYVQSAARKPAAYPDAHSKSS